MVSPKDHNKASMEHLALTTKSQDKFSAMYYNFLMSSPGFYSGYREWFVKVTQLQCVAPVPVDSVTVSGMMESPVTSLTVQVRLLEGLCVQLSF